MSHQDQTIAQPINTAMITMLKACGFEVRRNIVSGQHLVQGTIENAAALYTLTLAGADAASPPQEVSNDAAAAAIQYALEKCDGNSDSVEFLRYWNEGQFDLIRRNWHDTPEVLFIGADPLHPQTIALLAAASERPYGSCCTCPSGDGSLRWPCPLHPAK